MVGDGVEPRVEAKVARRVDGKGVQMEVLEVARGVAEKAEAARVAAQAAEDMMVVEAKSRPEAQAGWAAEAMVAATVASAAAVRAAAARAAETQAGCTAAPTEAAVAAATAAAMAAESEVVVMVLGARAVVPWVVAPRVAVPRVAVATAVAVKDLAALGGAVLELGETGARMVAGSMVEWQVSEYNSRRRTWPRR